MGSDVSKCGSERFLKEGKKKERLLFANFQRHSEVDATR